MFDYQITKTSSKPVCRFIFAHGAGAGCQTPFMEDIARQLAELGIEVWRFNFPYMQTMLQTGKRRPPEKMTALESHFNALLDKSIRESESLPTFIGGKSMGGRVATQILDASEARGAVVFGYPFHPPGKPEKLRTGHLETIAKPVCICQGERDTFGTQAEVEHYPLASTITVSFLSDGDHSLKPRKKSDATLQDNLSNAARTAATFMLAHSKGKTS
ncbi:alpha/beta hydrolase [Salinimonas sp. HHU 13199]|uniref:Alpha/beta hydrolase n=1 Tax=Salinimonas profundi TaxID=2729140 RepID=A0ABR8LHG5_9ALTE|nr:alpha/beta family hydrolase [Salinimonas profundi]MBD3584963.1 alpha/beta hydrolase [Salinimonas profundi]